MVDFSEALKARIESMSPDELAATEVRRLAREAEKTDLGGLEAVWEPLPAGKSPSVTKQVTIRVDPGSPPGSPDVLRVLQGTTFHESIFMTPAVYRLIIGGTDSTSKTPDRFIVNPGGPGYDRISVDRSTLASLMARERPTEMMRAIRLLDVEKRSRATAHLPIDRQIALFEERWETETIAVRIEAAVSRVSSRALLLLAGKDHVALWVRREDLTVGPGRILGSVLAGAIVRPDQGKGRSLMPGHAADPNGLYLQNTFGSGPERTLVLDVGRVAKLVAVQPKEGRSLALALFERLIDRSAALGRDRIARGASGRHALEPARSRS